MRRARRHRLAATLVAVAALRPATSAAQQAVFDMPDVDFWRLTAGPSLAGAWEAQGGAGTMPGFDLTLSYSVAWASLGVRSLNSAEGFLLPYAEAGVWFFGTWGVGYDQAPGFAGGGQGGHLFAGFPLPLLFNDDFEGDGAIVEPYARTTVLWGDRTAFVPEGGLLIKGSLRL